MNNDFDIALTESDFNDILENKSIEFNFNPIDEYNSLSSSDKIALKHLIKAAKALDKAFLEQDHSKNLEIKKFLIEASNSGDLLAEKALKLFCIFNGIEGNDGISKQPVRLFKNLELAKGKNVFPEDITKEELILYLKSHIEEIPAILSFDTIVRRDHKGLVAIPYYIYFKKYYQIAAKELLLAAKLTTHKTFSKYLSFQAQALVSNDPEYSYKADELWANLLDSPLEFTIGRESYEDTMTGALVEDDELMSIIDENALTIKAKDFIGVRVGIVDIEASKDLMDYKNHLKGLAALMPMHDTYKQSIDQMKSDSLKQTLVDVDLVYLSGDYRACRPGITLAQNLPNDDKLSVQLKAGNRNVFHKQVRRTEDVEKRKKLLNSLVDPQFHDLYDIEADHFFTIGHELTHSLGPMTTRSGKDKKVSLGDSFGDIIEEAKADLGSLCGIEYFVSKGKYSQELANKILLTWAVDQMPLSEPNLNQAHRVREVMQLNYFIEKGAILIKKDEKLKVDFQKIIPTAKEMLEEVIKIQLEGNPLKAKDFVDKYRNWNETLQYISDIKKSLSPKPYKILNMPIAEKLLLE